MTGQAAPHEASGAAVACGIGMLVSVVPFNIGTFPLFLLPVSAEFGWGRATFATSLGVAAISAAVAAPFAGRWVDRWGGRRVLLPAVLLYGLATMAQSLLSESRLQFYLIYGCFGLAAAAAGPVAYSQVVSAWFRQRRGLALALVLGACPTISAAVMAPATRGLIEHLGWRHAYIALGLTILVLGLPAMAFLLKDPPLGPGPMRPTVPSRGLAMRRILATSTFWIILGALAVHALALGAVRGHSVALLTDRGETADTATLALSLWALAGLAGNIVSGILMDRLATPRVALPFFVAALAGLVLFDHASGTVTTLAGAAIVGFGVGAESGLGPYFISRYFGLRAFGQAYGLIISTLAIGSAVGPALLGASFDRLGSYRWGELAAEGGLASGIILVLLLGPYVYPVEEPDAVDRAGTRPPHSLAIEGEA